MRKGKSRLTSLLFLLALCLLGASVWAWAQQGKAADAASRAASDVELCQKLSTRIQSLRQRPKLAGSREIEIADLTRRIEHAAQLAQIPTSALTRIAPQPAIRVTDNLYQEKPTQLALRSITLKQITTFLHHLSSASDGANLQIKDLRLTAPRDGQGNDLWSAEATVSYLIYSPQATPKGLR